MLVFQDHGQLSPQNVRFLQSLGYKINSLYNKNARRLFKRYKPYSIRR